MLVKIRFFMMSPLSDARGPDQRISIHSDQVSTENHGGTVGDSNSSIRTCDTTPVSCAVLVPESSSLRLVHEDVMTDSEIESFIGRFEDCSLPKSEWTHRKHLVMALWYLRRNSRDEAMQLIREGIQRYNESQGNHTGYHETITLAWIAVIGRFLLQRDPTSPISTLANALLEVCGDRNYLLRFYSRDRLFGAEARSRWIPPDLADLPQCDVQDD
jgi:hypothetical protein